MIGAAVRALINPASRDVCPCITPPARGRPTLSNVKFGAIFAFEWSIYRNKSKLRGSLARGAPTARAWQG